MNTPELVDPQAMVRPLLEAVPGSSAVCTCLRCGGLIVGPAALDSRQFFVHPDTCPEEPLP